MSNYSISLSSSRFFFAFLVTNSRFCTNKICSCSSTFLVFRFDVSPSRLRTGCSGPAFLFVLNQVFTEIWQKTDCAGVTCRQLSQASTRHDFLLSCSVLQDHTNFTIFVWSIVDETLFYKTDLLLDFVCQHFVHSDQILKKYSKARFNNFTCLIYHQRVMCIVLSQIICQCSAFTSSNSFREHSFREQTKKLVLLARVS